MELQIGKKELSDGINIVSKAVASGGTMPILDCILLTAADNGIRLMANNLELGIQTTNIEAGVLEPGRVALDAKLFDAIVKKLPDDDIHISSNEKLITTIKCGKSKFDIAGLAADEFPALPEVERENKLTIKRGALRDMIKQTIFSVNEDNSKPTLTGELIEVAGDRINMVSCDGFRMSHRYIKTDSEECPAKVIVPGKTMGEIVKLLSGSDDSDTTVYFTENHILFELDTCTVTSRLIGGEFLNYAQTFPTDHKTLTEINRVELIASLERACLVATETGKKTPVVLDIQNDKVTVTSHTEKGALLEEIAAESEGDSLKIEFNSRYLIDALKAIEDPKVAMYFNGNLTPCVIRPVDGGNYEYLVLPMRLSK